MLRTFREKREEAQERLNNILDRMTAINAYEEEKELLLKEYWEQKRYIDMIEFNWEEKYKKGLKNAELDGFVIGRKNMLKQIAVHLAGLGYTEEGIGKLLDIDQDEARELVLDYIHEGTIDEM